MSATEAIFEKESDLSRSHGQGPPPIVEDKPWGPDDNGSNGDPGRPIDNAMLAILLFIGADVMLFAGLIGAFIVFRFGAEDWPPAGQPLLPIGVTAVNTGILLASGFTMIRTWGLLANWNRRKILRGLLLTTVLGITFLLVQGLEWVRLIGFGLTIDSGIYGSIFYTLIGCHAVHVAGAVIWLAVVAWRFNMRSPAYLAHQHVGIKLIGMYWILVVVLWPLLYGLVYLG